MAWRNGCNATMSAINTYNGNINNEIERNESNGEIAINMKLNVIMAKNANGHESQLAAYMWQWLMKYNQLISMHLNGLSINGNIKWRNHNNLNVVRKQKISLSIMK